MPILVLSFALKPARSVYRHKMVPVDLLALIPLFSQIISSKNVSKYVPQIIMHTCQQKNVGKIANLTTNTSQIKRANQLALQLATYQRIYTWMIRHIAV